MQRRDGAGLAPAREWQAQRIAARECHPLAVALKGHAQRGGRHLDHSVQLTACIHGICCRGIPRVAAGDTQIAPAQAYVAKQYRRIVVETGPQLGHGTDGRRAHGRVIVMAGDARPLRPLGIGVCLSVGHIGGPVAIQRVQPQYHGVGSALGEIVEYAAVVGDTHQHSVVQRAADHGETLLHRAARRAEPGDVGSGDEAPAGSVGPQTLHDGALGHVGAGGKIHHRQAAVCHARLHRKERACGEEALGVDLIGGLHGSERQVSCIGVHGRDRPLHIGSAVEYCKLLGHIGYLGHRRHIAGHHVQHPVEGGAYTGLHPLARAGHVGRSRGRAAHHLVNAVGDGNLHIAPHREVGRENAGHGHAAQRRRRL